MKKNKLHAASTVLKISAMRFLLLILSQQTTQLKIAESLGAKVFQKEWMNNHAKQFNWGLENLPIKTDWVLRLDADEYLTPELANEINQKLSNLNKDITGVILKRQSLLYEPLDKARRLLPYLPASSLALRLRQV